MHRDLIRSGRFEELETRLVAELRTSPPELFGERPWLLAITLRNQGRLREARDLATDGTIPGTNRKVPDYREPIMLATSALEGGEPGKAASLFLGFVKSDRARNDGAGFVARNLSWHMTLAATALAAAGDTAMVRALGDSIQRIGQRSSFVRDYRIHHFVHGLLLQRQNRHADAVEAFRRSLVSMTDGYTRINLELARSLVAIQQYQEAIAVLQPALRGGVDGANTYVTHTELHEMLAQAFYSAGQRDSASTHYAAVERAWRRADPIFRSRYELARQRSTPAP
jgi:tetratricopeptide (TPR) repeat protein